MLFNITFFSWASKPTVSIEADTLLAALMKHLKTGANLYGADLRRADLRGADLRGADLYGADLYGADLYGADLYGADLHGANLCGANLHRADLYAADLHRANLYGADLHGANLCGANLCGANLYGANLCGADLCGANLCGANLYGADLCGVNLYGANLLRATDMKYLKGLSFDTWEIGYTSNELQIGCQRHEISKWQKWNTPAGRKWIASMDHRAMAWADKYMALVLEIVRLAPAMANDPAEGSK